MTGTPACCRNTNVYTQVQLAANPEGCPHGTKNSELCHMTVHHSETTTSQFVFLQKCGILDTESGNLNIVGWSRNMTLSSDASFLSCIHNNADFMKVNVFCIVMLCSKVDCYQCFEGTVVSIFRAEQ